MKLLWTKDLKMNTVHVRDVVRALWHLKDVGPPGEIYNLVDKGETSEEMNVNKVIQLLEQKHSVSIIDIIAMNIANDLMSITMGTPVPRYLLIYIFGLAQGVISELVSRLFGIEHGYQGSIISNLAKVISTQ